MEKLRLAYFPDTTDTDAIRNGNIALMSDSSFGDSILKATALQANANSRTADENEPKNTFLYRLLVRAEYIHIFLLNIEVICCFL